MVLLKIIMTRCLQRQKTQDGTRWDVTGTVVEWREQSPEGELLHLKAIHYKIMEEDKGHI